MYWLTIIVFYGEAIVHGPESDGWAPRLQPDYEICNERREFLEDHWVPYLIEVDAATHAIVACTKQQVEAPE